MHPGVKATEEHVMAALTAEVRGHHRVVLQERRDLIEVQDRSITRLETEMERHLSPCEKEMERGEHITGVSRQVLPVLMAEIGTDLERFPDTEHLSSWAGVCPAQNERAGKRRGGRARKGHRYLQTALVQAAQGVRRSRTSLGEHSRRLKKRRGSKRAALAVGQSILVIDSHMMKTGEEYQEKGEAFFARKDQGNVEQQLARRLEHLGYQVTRPSQPVASSIEGKQERQRKNHDQEVV